MFNTALTGYQEILTDPSYARQIITFTVAHVGNTGCTSEDAESNKVWAAGLVIRNVSTSPSSYRAQDAFQIGSKKWDRGYCRY